MESKHDDDDYDRRAGSKSAKSGGGSDSEGDSDVEREFKALMTAPASGQIAVSMDPAAAKIADGFKINWCVPNPAPCGVAVRRGGVRGHMCDRAARGVRGHMCDRAHGRHHRQRGG